MISKPSSKVPLWWNILIVILSLLAIRVIVLTLFMPVEHSHLAPLKSGGPV